MTTEADLINILKALGVFTGGVSYVVGAGESDASPPALPFFILGGAEIDFNTNITFCGTALQITSYQGYIGAGTASEARALSETVRIAISSIASVSDQTEDYEPDNGAYTITMTITA